MSFSDSAPSATTLRRALTTLIVGATAASVAILAPVFPADRAAAHSVQPARSEIVTIGTETGTPHSVRAASLWTDRPSILVVPAGATAAG
jgi:hypothetical protein